MLNFVNNNSFRHALSDTKGSYMLFSYINMKLRDTYSSLDDLCDDMHVNKENLCDQLAKAGFQYSKELNKFW